MALSDKQRAWVESYLKCWNATQAAIDAGYSEHSARKQGSRMSTNVDIQAAIQERLAELKMSADEVLSRLTAQARGTIGAFLATDDAGRPSGFSLESDRPLSLVKKVSVTKNGWSFEMYDAQAALALLGKAHGLFIEKTEQNGAITLTVTYESRDSSETTTPDAAPVHLEPGET